MAQENWQKYKLLKLLELLRQETDEQHPLATSALCNRLAEMGISCERRTLTKDIAVLNELGYEVMWNWVGKEKGYYIEDRSFSVPELKILIDAVQAASFITDKKTAELIDKISELGGTHKADILKSNMVCFNTRKHSNESIYYSGADLHKQENVTVYDMTMGTSQMLSCMEERIHEINPDMEVTCFGQEFNPSTFAIAKADMMIRGGNPDNMRFGDTLSDDKFTGYTFRYIISNPPFGIDWKREQKAVEAEAAKGEEGRFAPGLPKISDGQQLFVLNGLKKLDAKGKMAIIQNGSPLFAGDAGSGPSEIRRYILENDWLDCIIQLSTDMFMNTGISTYIWVLNKNKPSHRVGKVQLIDASHCYTARRKSIGTKRNDISDSDRELIVKAYAAFENGGIYGDKAGVYCESKIFTTDEFGYNKIVVERPQRDVNGAIVKKKGAPVADAALRDTENVPLTEDIDAYFAREVLPYAPDAWMDKKKTKIGYEIPMTRYFYEYTQPEASEDILSRIIGLEDSISASLKNLFGEE